jgi:uncharacterized RDD family membrane protein YckC
MAKWRDVKQNRVQKEEPILTTNKAQNSDLASLGSRLKAFLTDTFLITTPIFYIVIYFIMGSGDEFAQNRVLGWSIIFALHFILILVFWLKSGQTPGMKAYSIKLVDSTSRQRVGVFQVVIRYIATSFALIPIFYFIPYLNKDKKTLQDIVSNTVIINEK